MQSSDSDELWKSDVYNLDVLILLSATDYEVRKGIVEDPERTIERFHEKLHFHWDDLSVSAQALLKSLTSEELESIHSVYKKTERLTKPMPLQFPF